MAASPTVAATAPKRPPVYTDPLTVGHADYFSDPRNIARYPCAPPAPAPLGELAPGLVQLAMHSIEEPLKQCYVDALRRERDRRGRILVELTVEPTGSVSVAKATCTTIADEAMVNCVLDQVRSAKFPKPSDGPARLTYPLLFETEWRRADATPKSHFSGALMPPLEVLVDVERRPVPSGPLLSWSTDAPACEEHWASTGEPRLPPRLPKQPPIAELDTNRWPLAKLNCALPFRRASNLPDGTMRAFVSFANALHHRIHPIFTDHYIAGFEQLPADHPLYDYDLSVTLMFEIDVRTGDLLRVAIPESSGQPLLDVAALDSLLQALPIDVSPNLANPGAPARFTWEFHRRPKYACSTYFVWIAG